MNTLELPDDVYLILDAESELLKSLNLKGCKVMVGDGFPDYQTLLDKAVDYFIQFTEVDNNSELADKPLMRCNSFHEVIEFLGSLFQLKQEKEVA